MIEPVAVTLIGVSATSVVKAIELAWTARRSQAAGTAASDTARRESQELALHYWGCLLHEMRAGCERIRYMVQQAQVGGLAFGPFDFSVSEALMPDFCRVVPSPRLLEHFQSILSALRRVDFFQRAAGLNPAHALPSITSTAPEVPPSSSPVSRRPTTYEIAAGFAKDAIDKKIVGRFNGLVRLGHEVGRSIHGPDDWAGDASGILPDQIDHTAEIDHSRI